MAARPTLAALITRTRQLIFDTGTPVFTDQQPGAASVKVRPAFAQQDVADRCCGDTVLLRNRFPLASLRGQGADGAHVCLRQDSGHVALTPLRRREDLPT